MFYNINNQKFNEKDFNMKLIKTGMCATIYGNNDIIFKKYFKNTDNDCRLDLEMFNILKDIDSNNFIKLYDAYYEFSLLNIFRYMFYKDYCNKYAISAYTAKYYNNYHSNIWLVDKDYLLENINSLLNLFIDLSNNLIVVDDLSKDNCIFTKDNIVLIDPDLFYIKKDNKLNIKRMNIESLFNLFIDIMYQDLNKLDFISKEEKNKILCEFETMDTEKDISYVLSKKLTGVKRPVELFKH